MIPDLADICSEVSQLSCCKLKLSHANLSALGWLTAWLECALDFPLWLAVAAVQYLLGAPLDDPRKATVEAKERIFQINEARAKHLAVKESAKAKVAAAAAKALAAAAGALNHAAAHLAFFIQEPNAPAAVGQFPGMEVAELEGGGQVEGEPAVQAPEEALPHLPAPAPVEVEAPPEDMEID